MTVSAIVPVITYTLTGVSDYPYPYRIFEESDITVVHLATDDSVATLVLDTDYTVTMYEDGTGYVTMLDTDLEGQIIISRDLPVTQEVDWVNNDPLDMVVQENSFDKLTMLIQEITASAITYPAGFPATVEFPLPRSEAVIGWSTDATTLVNYPSYGSFQTLYDGAVAAAANAATSETNASNSATAAATSESNAAISESNASNSATAAATSESNAAISESNASDSATAAATSESNASDSATAAATSESNASDSADAAALSAQNASDSADAAAASAALIDLPSATIPDESGYQIQAEDDGAGSPQWTLVPETRGKNVLRNPLCYMWQRYDGSPLTTTNQLLMDALRLQYNGTSGSLDRIVGTEINGYYYSDYGVSLTHTIGTLDSDHCRLQFRLDQLSYLQNLRVTINILADIPIGNSVAVGFRQNFGTGGSSEVEVVCSDFLVGTGAPTVYTVYADMPSISGQTIGTDPYLKLEIYTDAGADQTVANSLGHQPSGTINFYAFQLREGTRDRIFEIPSKRQMELDEYWYYQRLDRYNWPGLTGIFGTATTAITSGPISEIFLAPMRSLPTLLASADLSVRHGATGTGAATFSAYTDSYVMTWTYTNATGTPSVGQTCLIWPQIPTTYVELLAEI